MLNTLITKSSCEPQQRVQIRTQQPIPHQLKQQKQKTPFRTYSAQQSTKKVAVSEEAQITDVFTQIGNDFRKRSENIDKLEAEIPDLQLQLQYIQQQNREIADALARDSASLRVSQDSFRTLQTEFHSMKETVGLGGENRRREELKTDLDNLKTVDTIRLERTKELLQIDAYASQLSAQLQVLTKCMGGCSVCADQVACDTERTLHELNIAKGKLDKTDQQLTKKKNRSQDVSLQLQGQNSGTL